MRACAVRARPPSETRRRVCHVSSGDQHRSSKMDSSVGEAVGGPWAWLWAWVRWVLCCAVRPLSRQGISTACPLGTDLGMKVDLPRPPRGAGQVGAVQGGGAGRGRLLGTRGGAVCACKRGGRRRADAARSPAAVGAGWTQRQRGARPRCGAAPGERAKGGGGKEGAPKSHVVLVPSSSRERRRDPGVSSLPTPIPPPPPPRTEAWACWPHTKWCEEFSPRSFDLGVVHDSLLIVGQHARNHAPRLLPSPQCTPYAARFESRAIAHLQRRRPAGKASSNWPEISWPEMMNEFLRRGRDTGQREKQ